MRFFKTDNNCKKKLKRELKNLSQNVDERDEEQNAGFLDCW